MFDKAYNFTKQNEGGFSNHQRDSGGKTIYGITSKYYPETYQKVMTTIEKGGDADPIVKKFYKDNFWNPLYEKIFYPPLAVRLFDLGVNIGIKKSVRLLQRTFNRLSTIKISEDGDFGQLTLKAVNSPPFTHDVFYDGYITTAERYYRSLRDFDVFGKGWVNRLHKPIG
uniref:Putative glycoside hydrolase n=1 Tax=viral metagenome TaxID=1070528 RepID=A0A6H2A476_9ZZZZ